MGPAHPQSADGRERCEYQDDQDGAEPRDGARPMPQCDPRAEAEAGCCCRYCGLGARGIAKRVLRADTAGSAREVWEAKDPSRAAIASRLAAEIYGLEILKENVEDESHSTTRFVVLSREKKWAKPGAGKVVTTFVFRVRNVPAALYKALGGFATNGVNMTKLESYMVGGHFAATQFLDEVGGHPDDQGLRNALEELAFFTTDVKILGVYPADAFRAD